MQLRHTLLSEGHAEGLVRLSGNIMHRLLEVYARIIFVLCSLLHRNLFEYSTLLRTCGWKQCHVLTLILYRIREPVMVCFVAPHPGVLKLLRRSSTKWRDELKWILPLSAFLNGYAQQLYLGHWRSGWSLLDAAFCHVDLQEYLLYRGRHPNPRGLWHKPERKSALQGRSFAIWRSARSWVRQGWGWQRRSVSWCGRELYSEG